MNMHLMPRLNVTKKHFSIELVARRDININISKVADILGKNVQLQFNKLIKSKALNILNT